MIRYLFGILISLDKYYNTNAVLGIQPSCTTIDMVLEDQEGFDKEENMKSWSFIDLGDWYKNTPLARLGSLTPETADTNNLAVLGP